LGKHDEEIEHVEGIIKRVEEQSQTSFMTAMDELGVDERIAWVLWEGPFRSGRIAGSFQMFTWSLQDGPSDALLQLAVQVDAERIVSALS
jgi:hypothetical protein